MSQRYLPEAVRARVRDAAGHRCGYCLSPQRLVLGWLEIEHVVPQARGGSDDEENLWLACRMCNNYKSDHSTGLDPESGEMVTLFNPRSQTWAEHLCWSADGTRILGQTPVGRATVVALQLNNEIALTVRGAWVAAGWHPPEAGGAPQLTTTKQG